MNNNSSLRANWMQFVPNQQLKLTALTIPGTHDTCTSGVDRVSISRCQEMTLAEQLERGIRFIDIRLVPATNGSGVTDLQLYHGIENLRLWFSTDVLDVCKKFLVDHPAETIVMCIKKEDSAVTDADFVSALAGYLSDGVFYREWDAAGHRSKLHDQGVPTLDEAKGSIVLFRRYSGSRDGIDAHTGWPGDDETKNPTRGQVPMMVQDIYAFQVGTQGDKWKIVDSFLTRASQDTSDTWWVNFSSASVAGLPPRLVSDTINPQLQGRLDTFASAGNSLRLGTIVMDFPTDHMIDMLIARNHIDAPGHLAQNTPYQLRLAKLSPGDEDAYVGDPHLASNRWNYGHVYAGTTSGKAIHSLHKVDGSDGPGIHVGDVVQIKCTTFRNDDYIYLAGNKDGTNCTYDRQSKPYYGPDDIRWKIVRSPASDSSALLSQIQEGDPVRLENLNVSALKGTARYLGAAKEDGYLNAQDPNTPHSGLYRGGFDWVLAR